MKLSRKSSSSVESGQTESYHFEIATTLPLPFFHFPFPQSLPPHQSLRAPVVFTTRLSRVLGYSTVNLNSVLSPGGHTSLGYSAAAGQAGHLARR